MKLERNWIEQHHLTIQDLKMDMSKLRMCHKIAFLKANQLIISFRQISMQLSPCQFPWCGCAKPVCRYKVTSTNTLLQNAGPGRNNHVCKYAIIRYKKNLYYHISYHLDSCCTTLSLSLSGGHGFQTVSYTHPTSTKQSPDLSFAGRLGNRT